MISLQEQLRPLLMQFNKATGRGNVIQANDTLTRIIHCIAATIDHQTDSETTMMIPSVINAPAKRPRGRPPKRCDD